MVRVVLSFFLFFLYFSNIQFVFLPDKIRTRLIVGVIGFVYYVFNFGGRDFYQIRKIAMFLTPLALWMALSIVVNTDSQTWFLQFVILQILFAFGAAMIIHIGNLNDYSKVLWFFLCYVVIQELVSFASYQIPAITSLIHRFQAREFDDNSILWRNRAMGLGEFKLFGGGVFVAIGILSMTMLYKFKKLRIEFYIPLLLFSLLSGLFVARTSLTGIFALLLLLFPLRKNWYKLLWGAGLGVVFLALLQYQERSFGSQGIDTDYAFELFDKYRDTGKVQSNSFDVTKEMWQVLPTDLSTWFIGDAKYEDARGGYYMHTDVGYLRVIFYGGIVGLFFYILYSCKLARRTYVLSGKDKMLTQFLIMYVTFMLIWMWKGHYDVNCVLFFFLFSMILQKAPITKVVK